MIPPLLGMAFVLGLLVGLISMLRRWAGAIHPELLRKLLHVAMGLAATVFPWLFSSAWPVLALAAITLPGMLALRHSALLQRHFGGVIDGIHRRSWGEIAFPAGVCLAFILSNGDPLRYCLPVALLALADPAAALVGLQFGRRGYATADGEKTIEGSLAFFVVAFVSAQSILLLMTGMGHIAILLIAALLSCLLMIVEALSWAGLDNLFIPVFGFAILNVLLSLEPTTLLGILALAICAAGVLALRARPIRIDDRDLYLSRR